MSTIKKGNSIEPNVTSSSDLEVQLLLQLNEIGKKTDPRELFSSLMAFLTTCLPYLEGDDKYDKYGEKIDEVTQPNIRMNPTTFGNKDGVEIKDQRTSLEITVENQKREFGLNVFRDYQYQNMNRELYKIFRDVLRDLISEGKLNWNAKRKLSSYTRQLMGHTDLDESDDEPRANALEKSYYSDNSSNSDDGDA